MESDAHGAVNMKTLTYRMLAKYILTNVSANFYVSIFRVENYIIICIYTDRVASSFLRNVDTYLPSHNHPVQKINFKVYHKFTLLIRVINVLLKIII